MLNFEPRYIPNINRIENEYLSLVDPSWYSFVDEPEAVVLVPKYIAFHKSGFIMTRGTRGQFVLEHGLDYTFGLLYREATLQLGTEVYCCVILSSRWVIDEYGLQQKLYKDSTIRASYNAIGGPYFRPEDNWYKTKFSRVNSFLAHTTDADDYLDQRDFSKTNTPAFF